MFRFAAGQPVRGKIGEVRKTPQIFVGCAGWSIPKTYAEAFPASGSHLERYARRFSAVEINSSFYRPHRPATYARWAASVPDEFRFAVKMPREITHKRRLANGAEPLKRFLSEIAELGGKLGPVLIQLSPRLAFDAATAGRFFAELREQFTGQVVCEPRHPSWLEPRAEELLIEARVARAAADPAVTPTAAEPGAWCGFTYYRLHGSPKTYYSAYGPEFLLPLASSLIGQARAAPAWCIFDNTAEGHAARNALDLLGDIETIQGRR